MLFQRDNLIARVKNFCLSEYCRRLPRRHLAGSTQSSPGCPHSSQVGEGVFGAQQSEGDPDAGTLEASSGRRPKTVVRLRSDAWRILYRGSYEIQGLEGFEGFDVYAWLKDGRALYCYVLSVKSPLLESTPSPRLLKTTSKIQDGQSVRPAYCKSTRCPQSKISDQSNITTTLTNNLRAGRTPRLRQVHRCRRSGQTNQRLNQQRHNFRRRADGRLPLLSRVPRRPTESRGGIRSSGRSLDI